MATTVASQDAPDLGRRVSASSIASSTSKPEADDDATQSMPIAVLPDRRSALPRHPSYTSMYAKRGVADAHHEGQHSPSMPPAGARFQSLTTNLTRGVSNATVATMSTASPLEDWRTARASSQHSSGSSARTRGSPPRTDAIDGKTPSSDELTPLGGPSSGKSQAAQELMSRPSPRDEMNEWPNPYRRASTSTPHSGRPLHGLDASDRFETSSLRSSIAHTEASAQEVDMLKERIARLERRDLYRPASVASMSAYGSARRYERPNSSASHVRTPSSLPPRSHTPEEMYERYRSAARAASGTQPLLRHYLERVRAPDVVLPVTVRMALDIAASDALSLSYSVQDPKGQARVNSLCRSLTTLFAHHLDVAGQVDPEHPVQDTGPLPHDLTTREALVVRRATMGASRPESRLSLGTASGGRDVAQRTDSARNGLRSSTGSLRSASRSSLLARGEDRFMRDRMTERDATLYGHGYGADDGSSPRLGDVPAMYVRDSPSNGSGSEGFGHFHSPGSGWARSRFVGRREERFAGMPGERRSPLTRGEVRMRSQDEEDEQEASLDGRQGLFTNVAANKELNGPVHDADEEEEQVEALHSRTNGR